jgi:hypothetical protein
MLTIGVEIFDYGDKVVQVSLIGNGTLMFCTWQKNLCNTPMTLSNTTRNSMIC